MSSSASHAAVRTFFNGNLNIILWNVVDYISFIFPAPSGQDLIVNEPGMSQHFDPFYTHIPDCTVPMPITVQDSGIHMLSQGMEEIHYNEDFKQEDGCISMDPEALETFFQSLVQPGSEHFLNEFQILDLNFGLDGTDTNSNVNQPMMNMASINDVQFSQMVNENQAYPADLENVEGLVFPPVKSENDLDHWKPLWTLGFWTYSRCWLEDHSWPGKG